MKREPDPSIRRLEPGMVCEIDDCGRPATAIVYSRKSREVLACCDSHESVVLDEDSPEYWHHCENCGCGLPIN